MNAWGKAWGKAWGGSWGLFLVPATELTPKQQVFVRTALEQVYSSDDASAIISFAKQHSLSVLDAVACVTANTAEKHLFITPKVQRKSLHDVGTERVLLSQSKKSVAHDDVQKAIFVIEQGSATRSFTGAADLTASATASSLFVAGKPKRQALKFNL